MFKKALAGTVALMLCAACLASCTSSNSSTPATTSAPPTTSAPTTTSAPDTTTSTTPSSAASVDLTDTASLTYPMQVAALIPTTQTTITQWLSQTQMSDPTQQALEQACMAQYPTITINDVVTPDSSTEAVASAMASGTNPQFYGGGYPTAQSYIFRNLAYALDDFISQTPDFAHFYQTQVAEFQNAGKTYGIPGDQYVMGFFYSKSMFAAAGITSVPTTWDEFEADAKLLTKPDHSQYGYFCLQTWGGWHFETWVREAGGDITQKNADGTCTLTFTQPGCITAGQFYQKLRTDNVVQSDMTLDYDGQRKEFALNHAAMMYDSIQAGTVSILITDGGNASDIGYFAALTGPNGTQSVLNGGDGWMIASTDTPDQAKASWCYLMMLLSQKQGAIGNMNAVDQGTLGAAIPNRDDIQPSDFGTVDPDMQAVMTAASAISSSEYWGKGAIGGYMDTAVGTIFENPTADIMSTFQSAQDQAAADLQTFNDAILGIATSSAAS